MLEIWFMIISCFLVIVYIIDVFCGNKYNMIKTKVELILSFIIPFYLWFLMLRDKWNELD